MTAKRKTMAGMGKGVDAFFEQPVEPVKQQDDKAVKPQDDKAVKQQDDLPVKQQDDEEFERATFYIRPDQQTKLEEVRIGLRKNKVKTNKSELVRMAIDLLAEQDVEWLARKMGRGE